MLEPLTTPFQERVEPLNQAGIWKHWSGYLVAPQYQHSVSAEYWAIRNSVSLLDTSPLFKYRFRGPRGRVLLERVLARNVGACAVGRAQYTCWCDERGFVLQDGVVLHPREGEYWLTAAEPALRTFRSALADVGGDADEVKDVSADYGILALQGPHAHAVIAQLTDDATPLGYFGVTSTRIAGHDVLVSRTGYTGDLGYEIWVRREDATRVWDALMAAGEGHGILPIGTTAMKMARVEAGLLLLGVDFHSSRFAWVDAQRETPAELGWGWMFRKLGEDARDFVGRDAIEGEMAARSSRWTTVGLAVDWEDYERVHHEVGIVAPMHEIYRETTMSVYRRGEKEWDYAGYASSFLTSSLLRTPLALAKVPLDLAEPGTEVDLEITVIRKPEVVRARVQRLPFFAPPRKTAAMHAPAPEAAMGGVA